MSEATVTRSRSVLDFNGVAPDPDHDGENWKAFYANENQRFSIEVSKEQYEELGKPAHVTIAIWPGDRQDLMESEDFPA